MQYSWLAIALLALVVIFGAVIGFRQSTSTIQRQATIFSFAMLAVMGIISCVVVPLLGWDSLFPMFALLSFILPPIVYAAVIFTDSKTGSATTTHDSHAGATGPAHAKLTRKKPLAKSLKGEENKVISAPKEEGFIASVGQDTKKQKSSRKTPTKSSRKASTKSSRKISAKPSRKAPIKSPRKASTKLASISTAIPMADKEVSMAAFEDEGTDKAPVQQNTSVVSQMPTLDEVKAIDAKAAATSETPASVKLTDVSAKPEPAVESVTESAPVAEFVDVAIEAAPAVPVADAPVEPTPAAKPADAPAKSVKAESAAKPADAPVETTSVTKPAVEPLSAAKPAVESSPTVKSAKSTPATKPAAKPADVPAKSTPAAKSVKPASVAKSAKSASAAKSADVAIEPAPARPASEPTFATCFAKATALKEKGAYAVAARLFAKGAALSESGADGRHARFEEIMCYVKADQPDRARALASEMREQATTMTKVERIKLDAIVRML